MLEREVLSKNRIFKQVYRQASKGIQKYGTLPVPEDYTALGWLQHRIEEATDQLIYTVALEQVILETVYDLEKALDHLELDKKHLAASRIFRALERLGGGHRVDCESNRESIEAG